MSIEDANTLIAIDLFFLSDELFTFCLLKNLCNSEIIEIIESEDFDTFEIVLCSSLRYAFVFI